MNRFQPSKETFAWSYTKFRDYRTCPRKFNEVTQLKLYKEEYTEALREGDSIHGAFERRVGKGMPMPTGLDYLTPWGNEAAKKINPVITMVAKELAITRDFKPTGYFANNVWYRAKLDQLDLYPRSDFTLARIIDFKTGNPKDDTIQLGLYAATVFIHFEDVRACRCEYWWTKTMEKTFEIFKREDMADLWAELLPELEKMETSQNRDDYPAKKNGLCKAYCPVIDCEHNGRRG